MNPCVFGRQYNTAILCVASQKLHSLLAAFLLYGKKQRLASAWLRRLANVTSARRSRRSAANTCLSGIQQ